MGQDPPAVPTSSLRHRAAQLGRSTVLLTGATVALFGVALWLLLLAGPGAESEPPAFLPFRGAGLTVFLAAGALTAATFVGMAAVQTAVAMRLLSPDRQHAEPLPASLKRLRHLALAPTALRRMDIERPPQWPDTAIPGPDELPPAGARLRCHVLIPAHDE